MWGARRRREAKARETYVVARRREYVDDYRRRFPEMSDVVAREYACVRAERDFYAVLGALRDARRLG